MAVVTAAGDGYNAAMLSLNFTGSHHGGLASVVVLNLVEDFPLTIAFLVFVSDKYKISPLVVFPVFGASIQAQVFGGDASAVTPNLFNAADEGALLGSAGW